jgi:hypothetical protein
MKKVGMIIGILSLIVILIGGGAGVWAYYAFLYTEPLSEAELAELTPDWSAVTHGNWSPWIVEPDGTQTWNPAGSFNAWLETVPEEDKAWPVLIETYYDCKDTVFENESYLEFSGTLPEHPQHWAIYKEFIETHEVAQLCAKIKDASKRPIIGCELLGSIDPYERAVMIERGIEIEENFFYDPNDESLFSRMNIPWFSKFRSFSNILRARAAYELELGNTDEYIELLETMDSFVSLNSVFPVLVSSLVDIALHSNTQAVIDWALSNHPDTFDESQLKRLDAIIESQMQYSIVWQGEELFFHDIIRRMCKDDGKTSLTKIANEEFGGPACSLPIAELSADAQRMLYVNHVSYEQAAILERVPWDQEAETVYALFERERKHLNKFSDLFLDMLMPSGDSSASHMRSFRQQAIATRLAISIYRHRQRHGVFPDSIGTIDQDLLTFKPIDAFTAEPLKYTLKDSKLLIYSVGVDRNDDNGSPMLNHPLHDLEPKFKAMANFVQPTSEPEIARTPRWMNMGDAEWFNANEAFRIDGDWVLFPMPIFEPDPIQDVLDQDESNLADPTEDESFIDD